MKTIHGSCGFEEVSHTADWALRVWAPDFPHLAATALEGMFELMRVKTTSDKAVERVIPLKGEDEVERLVSFLTEALYLLESEALALQGCDVTVDGQEIWARSIARPVQSFSKLIKAVTYHQLEIVRTQYRLECTLVFDV